MMSSTDIAKFYGVVLILLFLSDSAHGIALDRRTFLKSTGAVVASSMVKLPNVLAAPEIEVPVGFLAGRARFLLANLYSIKLIARRDYLMIGPEERQFSEKYGNLVENIDWQINRMLHEEYDLFSLREIQAQEEVYAAQMAQVELNLARKLGLPLAQVSEEVTDITLGLRGHYGGYVFDGVVREFKRKFAPLGKPFIEAYFKEVEAFFPSLTEHMRLMLPISTYGQHFEGYVRNSEEWYQSDLEVSTGERELIPRTVPRSVGNAIARTRLLANDEPLRQARGRIIALVQMRCRDLLAE
jgi:hypothetical protein